MGIYISCLDVVFGKNHCRIKTLIFDFIVYTEADLFTLFGHLSMLIKHKLIFNSAVSIASMILMLILLSFSSTSFQRDIELTKYIGYIEAEVLQLRRNEKDFLARKDLKYLGKFEKVIVTINVDTRDLQKYYEEIGIDIKELNQLSQVVKEYEKHFKAIVEAQKVIGLTAKEGLYGLLRDTVHDVESLIGDKNYQLLSLMLQLRRNEKDFMLRLDEKYVSRFHSNAEQLINNLNGASFDDQAKQNIIAKMNDYQDAFTNLVDKQKELGLDSESGLQGEMRKTIHQVDDLLSRIVKRSDKEISDYIAFIDTLAYSIFFVVLVVVVLSTGIISRSILTGIVNLKDTMNRVAETRDLSIVVQSQGKDELSEMANVFNSMISSFRHLIVEVNQSVGTLNQATQNLTENIHIANEGVDSQIQQTDMVATAVTEMVSTVDEIANTTKEAANKAELTNKNAEKGKEGVEKTIAQIDDLSQKLLASEQVVQELAKDSDTIGTVLDVIRGIADQTNLLALNAAIEAARAGEQGRGFAVVADEVRTLASRTQDSTREIETIINSLQGRTKEIVTHMASCRVQGQESAEQASNAGKMLVEITHDVATIMEMNTAIATAIQEQSTVASELNHHVVSIRDVAEQSGETSIQNGQMSEEIAQQAAVLNSEVEQFKV